MPYAEKHYACGSGSIVEHDNESNHSTDTHRYRWSTGCAYRSPSSSTVIPTGSSIPFRTERDAILPLSVPVKGIDGSLINKLAIPAGTRVIVPINNANCDPALWGPDSRGWKPERWLSPLPESLYDAHVPGVYSHMYVLWDYLLLRRLLISDTGCRLRVVRDRACQCYVLIY